MEENSSDPQCDLPVEDTRSAPSNELAPLPTNLAMNSLNTYTIVTESNGLVTLQPTLVNALPTLDLGKPPINPAPVLPKPSILPRRPVAIAPKPQLSAQVDTAVNDALAG